MVGVPGKYKGCNTCRARRVQCDNGRPFCRKCTDYGRECGGYERETVFIVGTPDDKGRCSSHPPRNQQSRKSKGKEVRQSEKLEFIATEPWQPAWVDLIALASTAGSHRVRFVALRANLNSAVQIGGSSRRGNDDATLSLKNFRVLDARPTFGHEPFGMRSRCLIHLPPKSSSDGSSGSSSSRQASGSGAEGLCLFLYEQNSSAAYGSETPWKGPAIPADRIRERGPASYQFFPEHHFFARVYRPSAIWAALLNRQPTFLCSPEWTVVPWERHPRTPFDDLLDIVVLLPSVYARADRLASPEASASRLSKAKDLFACCVNIETQFDIWYTMLHQRVGESGSMLCWAVDATMSHAHVPFSSVFNFPSPLIGLVHVYYWAVLVGFHQCIYALLEIILGSEDENSSGGPSVLPELPLGIDIQRYQPDQTRGLVENVCRSLDFVLQTTGQPDFLAAPLWAVKEYYDGLGRFGDGDLERVWCTGFKGRLEAKGREVGLWLQEKGWIDVKQFG